MKIQFKYNSGRTKIIEYDPNVNSVPTRHDESDERFVKAVMPKEIKDNSDYLYRLELSADSSMYGKEHLFEFI